MRYEYTETQPEFQVPDQEIRDQSDYAHDVPEEIPEDTEGSQAELTEAPEIPEDTESSQAELKEAPEIPEDVEPYRVEIPEDFPEIPEDVPGTADTENPGMRNEIEDSARHFSSDTDQQAFREIPEDTVSGKELEAMLFPDTPEIPEDTEPEANEKRSIHPDTDELPPAHDARDDREPAEMPVNEAVAGAAPGQTAALETKENRPPEGQKQGDAGPNRTVPESEPDNTEKFAKIGDWPKAEDGMEIGDALSDANPNYDEGEEWTVNCQRCVPTYEMRRRGFDVSALPCTDDADYLSYEPFDVWEDPEIISCTDDDENVILDEMSQWEDGARAQIVVRWAGGAGGHTFIAEKMNGEIRFVDPQTGDMECSDYFDEIEPGTTEFCRIDNLQPSEHILECCKEA